MKMLFEGFFPPGVLAFAGDGSVDFTLSDLHAPLTGIQSRHLRDLTGGQVNRLINVRQIHGRRVLLLSSKSFLPSAQERKADGALTGEPGIPLSVRTADCLPVFLYDKTHQVAGLLHAGWKGTHKKIISAALSRMKKKWDTAPGDLLVAFGPSIRTCCYQVGPEFKRYFPDETVKRHGQIYLDLPKANKHQLFKAGLKDRQIFDCGICTYCDHRYFSYRRQGPSAGRMLSLMMLLP